MRVGRTVTCFAIAGALWTASQKQSAAVEETFGLYPLGSGAIGAGQLPPAGFYFTTALSYAQFEASKSIPFGGTTITAKAYLPAAVGNLLAVLPQEILGGHLAASVTSGFGNVLFDASAVGGINVQKSVQGTGATDTSLHASLGWDIGPTFSHKITVTGVLPTGLYAPGFSPIIGLNRFGGDISWGATYIEPANKIELSGTAGFTYEGWNPATLYRSGNSVHFEEGLAKHFDNGFQVGVISYQYEQVSDDSGPGAKLGAFQTDAVAVGAEGGYATLISGHLVSFALQATREVAVKNRLRETAAMFSTTIKF